MRCCRCVLPPWRRCAVTLPQKGSHTLGFADEAVVLLAEGSRCGIWECRGSDRDRMLQRRQTHKEGLHLKLKRQHYRL
jgi:hypothetical protein